MYDSIKVISGIVIFLLILSLPIWYNSATGMADYVPEVSIAGAGTECIESTEFMRANHMHLLNDWRDDVVRGETRIYKATNG